MVGAGAAKMEASAKDAVGVKLWVRLAQAPSQQMSALAARYVGVDVGVILHITAGSGPLSSNSFYATRIGPIIPREDQ